MIIVGDFNTTLSTVNRSFRQQINKQTTELNTIDQTDLTEIYTTFHPKAAEYTFFSSAHRTFSRLDHMMGHNHTLLNNQWIKKKSKGKSKDILKQTKMEIQHAKLKWCSKSHSKKEVSIQLLPRTGKKEGINLWGNDSWMKATHILNRKPYQIHRQWRQKDWKNRYWRNVFCNLLYDSNYMTFWKRQKFSNETISGCQRKECRVEGEAWEGVV